MPKARASCLSSPFYHCSNGNNNNPKTHAVPKAVLVFGSRHSTNGNHQKTHDVPKAVLIFGRRHSTNGNNTEDTRYA